MCGIVGILGTDDVADRLLDGLKRLEYRGYDSAGIATVVDGLTSSWMPVTSNDENMLLIRGDTRVADIYLTEYDRILRHFYFRNVAAKDDSAAEAGRAIFLDETDAWVRPYYSGTGLKARRQALFFG